MLVVSQMLHVLALITLHHTNYSVFFSLIPFSSEKLTVERQFPFIMLSGQTEPYFKKRFYRQGQMRNAPLYPRHEPSLVGGYNYIVLNLKSSVSSGRQAVAIFFVLGWRLAPGTWDLVAEVPCPWATPTLCGQVRAEVAARQC